VSRLNFGCGYDMPTGWTNVDMLDYGGNIVADVLNGLPFPDEYFDCIVANHTLQMIRFHDLPAALAELRRVLRTRGVLRVLVPDLKRAIDMWLARNEDYFPVADEIEPTTDGKALRYMFWHGDARSGFTKDSLVELLWRAEFRFPVVTPYRKSHSIFDVASLDSREEESLIVECLK
jgi:SAM-dependent methyltransferase